MAWAESAREAKFLFKILGTELVTSVIDFTAHERISSPFEVNLSLVCEEEIKFDEVIAKEGLLTIRSDDVDRFLHGIINQFAHTGKKRDFQIYQARVVPSFWLLSLEQDCRIFQNKNVPDIVKQILQEGGIPSDRFAFRLQGQYPAREYCVQYRESDLNFISRLLEEEGIFYFFEHSKDKHILVFGDSKVVYKPIQGEPEVVYHPSNGMVPAEEYVYTFACSKRIHSGKVTEKDFNFEKPSLDLKTQEQEKTFQKLEVYDYPGEYLDQGRGKKLTQVRLQETVTFKEKAEGQSVCPRFTPGFTFKLSGHDRQSFDQEYLHVEVLHAGNQPQVLEELAAAGEFSYSNEFIGIPSSVIFRPERITPKPIVEGVQTAMVVGPKGEEIYTDKYGRVKVQFHWDREGAYDEKSSCWIRAASDFAGGNYGIIFIPRIGQEVVVDFLEGDPDQPIITGRVYNADNMPPYTLPNEKTKSTIKSNSSIGGKGFNEIRFEDLKGKEQIFIHGEKDLDFRVKNDRREWVGRDRHLVVKRDKREKVERDKHVIIQRDEIQEIQRDHSQKISGKDSIEVASSRSISVSGDVIEVFKANHSEQVTMNYYLKGMNVVIEGMVGLTVKVGGNFININPAGIFISGTMVMINSGGAPGVGTAGSIVPPAKPLESEIADTATPGKDVTYQKQREQMPPAELAALNAPSHQPTEEDKEKKKSWIEIELVDEEDNPIPGEKYRITLPDGKTLAEGRLDDKGFARVDGIDPGTCKITFPDLDKEAWRKV
jgi:type VI secretion system secreted protein VgrG